MNFQVLTSSTLKGTISRMFNFLSLNYLIHSPLTLYSIEKVSYNLCRESQKLKKVQMFTCLGQSPQFYRRVEN